MSNYKLCCCCHIKPRSRTSSYCCECNKEKSRNNRLLDKGKLKEYQKQYHAKYYEENKEKLNKYEKEYNKVNSEKAKETKRKSYLKNIEYYREYYKRKKENKLE